MEKNYFYYGNNRLLLKYTPILLFALCVFWSILDILTDDSMYFIKTGALFGVILMAITSAVSFLFFLKTDRAFLKKDTDKTLFDRLCKKCKVSYLFFMISVILGAAFVCGANNYAVGISGSDGTFQSISLSSTLLFIPVLVPFPEKKTQYIIVSAILASLLIPSLMPGKEHYSMLPELVLRIAICIALIVVSKKTEEHYILEEKVKNGNVKIVSMLVNLIELRDLESGKHVNKVSEYTKIMLEKLNEECPEYGFTPEQIKAISDASSTHDIGKLLIPDSILLKPGKLTPEEFEIMKTHTDKGAEILESLPSEIVDPDFLRYSLDICRYHHEKYDGKGYPSGLSGDDIPIWSQVVSIIDCYEALTSERHYKKAYSHETAIKMILNGECGAFSDKIIKCLLDCGDSFRLIVDE